MSIELKVLTFAESTIRCELMEMARTKIMRSYALDADLLERLEQWLAAQNPPPSRTGVIEAALRDFLDAREKGSRK